jgi:hypothetical protein
LPDNIAIITRFEHAFRAGNQATIDGLYDPGPVDHNQPPDHEPTLAGFERKVSGFAAIFPDLDEDLQGHQCRRRHRRHPAGPDRFSAAGVREDPRPRSDDQGRGHESLSF